MRSESDLLLRSCCCPATLAQAARRTMTILAMSPPRALRRPRPLGGRSSPPRNDTHRHELTESSAPAQPRAADANTLNGAARRASTRTTPTPSMHGCRPQQRRHASFAKISTSTPPTAAGLRQDDLGDDERPGCRLPRRVQASSTNTSCTDNDLASLRSTSLPTGLSPLKPRPPRGAPSRDLPQDDRDSGLRRLPAAAAQTCPEARTRATGPCATGLRQDDLGVVRRPGCQLQPRVQTSSTKISLHMQRGA